MARAALAGTPDHSGLSQRMVAMSRDGVAAHASWAIAIESPVEISLNGMPWTVMLATPADVEDLAVGLALTEGVLRSARAVQQVVVSEFLHDIAVNLVVPDDQLSLSALRSRSLLSSTACGLCGLESLAQLQGRKPRIRAQPERQVTDRAILAAIEALPEQQPLNTSTHSTHAAAWCNPDGSIVTVREDVGRHNALDKLIGALARGDMLAQPGFIVMSSRCSYELVYKAAVAETLLLATISAPTTMALDWANALSIPVACCMRTAAGMTVVRFDSVHETASLDHVVQGTADAG
jgi:FdhD protein